MITIEMIHALTGIHIGKTPLPPEWGGNAMFLLEAAQRRDTVILNGARYRIVGTRFDGTPNLVARVLPA